MACQIDAIAAGPSIAWISSWNAWASSTSFEYCARPRAVSDRCSIRRSAVLRSRASQPRLASDAIARLTLVLCIWEIRHTSVAVSSPCSPNMAKVRHSGRLNSYLRRYRAANCRLMFSAALANRNGRKSFSVSTLFLSGKSN